ncbi:MAG: DUF4038 domain-containing protein [Puniceicoccaceae bacterium]|nr:MAG: DUF4038 domain-containing protein [Puniceicoccaceae bacterium]
MRRITVSENRRFLVYDNGEPFFYLGDTAWELFHRLDEASARQYLTNRAGKGFTVIQAVAIAEADGLVVPNPYGHLPLLDRNPARPNEAYFRHVDHVIALANNLGMYVALLPCWGRYVWDFKPDADHVIFNPANARAYGAWLGRRYRDKGVIWVLGGDRPVNAGVERTWRAMAKGLREGDEGNHLISFHPYGGNTSAEKLHREKWLDFNMIQSGHARKGTANFLMIRDDYARKPVKPVMESEPCYEDLPLAFEPKNGRFDDYDCRVAAYWGVFSGGFGHTYGCNNVWQMFESRHPPLAWAERSWQDSLNLPGAGQMIHLRRLMESRPFLTRIPDPGIVYGNERPIDFGTDYQCATRDGTPGKNDATYLMVYRPLINWLSVDTSRIAGRRLRSWWYDPATGTAYPGPEFANSKDRYSGDWHSMPWRVCTSQRDWVLVIDDVSCGYPPPGSPFRQPDPSKR